MRMDRETHAGVSPISEGHSACCDLLRWQGREGPASGGMIMAFLYQDKMDGTSSEKNTEWCQHCDNEVEIPVNRITRCPMCGNYLRPCGECDPSTTGCDSTRLKGCWRFPFPSPLEIDTMIRLECGTTGFIREYDCEDDGNDVSQFCAYQVDFGGEDSVWEIVYHGEVWRYSLDGGETWMDNYADAWLGKGA